jgi:hypothetical protein
MIMYKLIKTYILISLFFIISVNNATSQITSSPYSLFGLGSIEGNSIGANKAMGGTGIALLSEHSINFLNPASYGGLDSLFTIFEIGLFGKRTSYKTGTDSQTLFDVNFKYIAMGFRVSSKWATSFGIIPYSTIGYKINSLSTLGGSNLSYYKTFTGEGGVNQLYFGNSYNITKNLILGINAVFLFGTVTHSESSDSFVYSLKDLTYLSNFNINYGLNYQFGQKKWKYNIGLIYNNGKRLKTENVSTIITANETETLKSQTNKFSIPQTYGLGFAIKKDYFRGGIDYEMKKWKQIDFNNPLLETRNSNRLSLGIEFPSLGIRRGSSGMIFYRFGAEYCKSYLVIKDVPVNYKAVSIGAGFPLKGALSIINLSLELGQNGTKKNGLIQENFCIFHIDFSLKEIWFVKRKYI